MIKMMMSDSASSTPSKGIYHRLYHRRHGFISLDNKYCIGLLVFLVVIVLFFLENAALTGKGDGGVALVGNRKAMVEKTDLSKKRAQPSFEHPMPHVKSLVLVACHSVFTGVDWRNAEDKNNWALLEYQRRTPGQVESFLEHIKLGVDEAARDENSMLVFSGGQTRKQAGPRSEANGYWTVAEANGWFGHGDSVRSRAFTEEHSRDSLENVLFSLCRFYELTGSYPQKIVVVSYEFKEERFLQTHRKAIKWPENRIEFIGTPALDPKAFEGEEKTKRSFEKDPYGCQGELSEKRVKRDPFAQGGYSADRCPDMEGLLDYCGTRIYPKRLPWT